MSFFPLDSVSHIYVHCQLYHAFIWSPHWTPIWWHTIKLHNIVLWSITKHYLSREYSHRKRIEFSPPCLLGPGMEFSFQKASTYFSWALIVHETTSKLEWYLKNYFLKEFQQYYSFPWFCQQWFETVYPQFMVHPTINLMSLISIASVYHEDVQE